jgi:hypothetical protein
VTQRITSRGIDIVNPGDADWTRHRYLFCLGAYGWTRCLVWANDEDSALDELGEWCAEHAPGLLADEAVAQEYQDARDEGLDEESAQERAELDTVRDGSGHYWLSWEMSYTADPTREQLLSFERDES